MGDLKAIIFDVDGTLAETERDGHRVAFNETFEDAGLSWRWSKDTYGNLLTIAGGKERIRFFIDHFQPPLPDTKDMQGLIAELHQAKTQRYRSVIQRGEITLRPGVARLIHAARAAGVRLAIATTSHLENAIALLETTLGSEALDWFEVIAAGDIVPHKKPAPDIYQYVLTQLGLSSQDCVVIEDSDQGLQAAKGAGLTVTITRNDYTRHHNFAGADLVLSDLGEPDCPFTVLAGQGDGSTHFTLDTARVLLNRVTQSPQP
jgi:HAD superfamily hydrolase (TIGR01509 family)